MSQDVQWQEIEIPVIGVNETVDPAIMPPGQFVDTENVEYTTQSGVLRKRPGIEKIGDGALSNAERLATFRDQLLIIDPEGSASISPAMYSPIESNGNYRNISTIPSATVERNPIISELGSTIVGDMAICNGFAVYAICNPRTNIALVRVKELISDSIILEQNIQLPGHTPVWIKAATSGTKVLIVYSNGGGSITGAAIDCSGTMPFVEVVSNIISNESPSSRELDVIGSGFTTPRWFVIYRLTPAFSDIGAIVEIKLANSLLSQGWNQGFGNDVRATSIVEVVTNPITSTPAVWVNWYDLDDAGSGRPGWIAAAFQSASGAPIFSYLGWCIFADLGAETAVQGLDTRPIASGISPNPDGSVLLFHTQYHTTDSISDIYRPMLRWRSADIFGVLGSLKQKRGLRLYCKPWPATKTGHHFVWTETSGQVSRTEEEAMYTLCLLNVEESSSRALIEATALGDIVGNSVFDAPSLSATGYKTLQSSQQDNYGNYHNVINMKFIANESVSGLQELVTRYDHPGRFSSVEFGGSTYFTGGVLTQYDGSNHFENSFLIPPVITVELVAGGGTWDAIWVAGGGSAVSYAVIYETVTATGERIKSQVSVIRTINITATTQQIRLRIEPMTVSRRFWSTNHDQKFPQTIVTVYRNTLPNGDVLQRLVSFDATGANEFSCEPETTTRFVFLDTGSNISGGGTLGTTIYTDIETHEVLYTDSGEQENVLPYGGCTCIITHKDRLWIGGGEDRELIWYSKPRADGRAAEFTLGQQIRIPGQKVIGLGSMDNLLYVFCNRGIFVIDGEGPNAVGDPASGSFSEPVPINLSIGCEQPRSVISTPTGIMFRADPGIYIVSRATRAVEFVGAPVIDSTASYPDIAAARIVPRKTQVRFSCTQDSRTANSPGIVLVYDWEEGKWSKWAYANVDHMSDIITWNNHNTAMLSRTGDLFLETDDSFIDDTEPYSMMVETGWLSFGRLQGYKRIRKIGMLLEKLEVHGLAIKMYFNYTKSGLSATKVFDYATINGMANPEMLRITVPYQKQPSMKIRLVETQGPYNPNTAGFVLKNFAFEIGMMPGNVRLPQKQTA